MGVAIQITSPLLIAASKNGLLYSRQNWFGVLYNSSGVFKRTNPPSFPEKSVVLGSCNSSIIFFVSISYLPNIVVVALGSAMISIPEAALYSRRFISASTPFTFGDAPLHSADAFPPLSPAELWLSTAPLSGTLSGIFRFFACPPTLFCIGSGAHRYTKIRGGDTPPRI